MANTRHAIFDTSFGFGLRKTFGCIRISRPLANFSSAMPTAKTAPSMSLATEHVGVIDARRHNRRKRKAREYVLRHISFEVHRNFLELQPPIGVVVKSEME